MHLPFAFVSGVSAPPAGPIVFDPPGDIYTTSVSVTITVSGASVTKFRYKNGGADSWHTVNALTTTITVNPTVSGKVVSCDALDSGGVVQSSHSEVYQKEGSGGGGGGL